jgi:thiol:disulfide interchange protein DsbD
MFENMIVRYFNEKVEFRQSININNIDTPVEGYLLFMACTGGKCLPPTEMAFHFDLKNEVYKIGKKDEVDVEVSDTKIIWPEVKNCGDTVVETKKKGLFGIFLLGFFGGLIALLTPCVFPMIPLTVSFFTKRSTDKKKGLANALMYGGFIALIYILFSIPFHFLQSISPDIFNNISTNVVLNVLFFVVFVAFAFSFFGYYELTLPAKWVNKADSASDVGGILGVFFMALTLALVSFSCTGPILGSLLAGAISAEGGAMQLTVGMAGFGIALAFPFALFAAFPGWLNSLPQSGGWLNTVKVVLGFLEIGLAMKFLSNADLVSHWGILKREIFLAIWILVGFCIVIYLLGKIKFPHDSPIKKLSLSRIGISLVFLAFTIYLIPGLWGANLKLISGFPPPIHYSLFNKGHCPLNLDCYKDYDEGLAHAKAVNKPILIDFTGWACVNCRRMEEKVWVDKEIFKRLSEDYVLISLYVDDRKSLPDDDRFKNVGKKWAHFQTTNFQNNSQPYYALISPDERVLNKPVGYTPNEAKYLDFLNCGLEAFAELNGTAKPEIVSQRLESE